MSRRAVAEKLATSQDLEVDRHTGHCDWIWVDYLDKAKSKYQNSPNFTISVYNSAFVRMHTDIEIDDLGHLLIYVMGLKQYNTPHQSSPTSSSAAGRSIATVFGRTPK